MIKDHTIDQCLVELARTMAALKALRVARKTRLYTCGVCYRTRSADVKACACRAIAVAFETSLDRSQHAAALRASFDLTHKLADLRQGR